MKKLKLTKTLEYNVEGFNATHQIETKLSLVEIFPEKIIKEINEDLIHLTVTSTDLYSKEERSAFTALNKQQLKELKIFIEEILKK
jgi:hypothetical protein